MKAVLPILLLLLISISAVAQEPGDESAPAEANALEEVRNLQSALLVVFRSRVL